LPYLKENPDWYAIEIIDGFSAHTASFEALQIRRDNRILCIKAEGDSSSVNQAYDKMVAKSDKAILHRTLTDLRLLKSSSGFIDQWDLIHRGL